MIQRNKKYIIITTVITLLPVIAGLILWNRLPDTIATHFNSQGVADGYSSKAGTVFTIFPFIMGAHLLCAFVTGIDPKRQNISDKIYRMILCICPFVSIICGVAIYGTALGYKGLNSTMFPGVVLGVMFILIGNYLPKCRQNYTIGIKLPWTLDNEENWNHTHRLAGRLWIAGGVILLCSAFVRGINQMVVTCTTIGIFTLIPVIYSFVFYLRQKRGE